MSDFIEEEEDNTENIRTHTIETRGVPLQTGEENADAEEDAADDPPAGDDSEKPENS